MSSEESVYRAPTSPLERPAAGEARSLESALSGDYDFEIGAVLSEAWALTKGSKGVILGALAITFGVNMATQAISFFTQSESGLVIALGALLSLVPMAIIYTINAGILLYAIKRAAGDSSASFDDVLSCFPLLLPIVGVVALQGLLTVVGFLLLILPGIYLAIGYLMAVPLKVERGLGIWESLETSRKSVHHRWLKLLGLSLVTGLIVMLGGLLTLGIGFIWLLPFGMLVYGIVYREIFGYSATGH